MEMVAPEPLEVRGDGIFGGIQGSKYPIISKMLDKSDEAGVNCGTLAKNKLRVMYFTET